jgi:hypothetical protein
MPDKPVDSPIMTGAVLANILGLHAVKLAVVFVVQLSHYAKSRCPIGNCHAFLLIISTTLSLAAYLLNRFLLSLIIMT